MGQSSSVSHSSQSVDAEKLQNDFSSVFGKHELPLEITKLAGDASTRQYFRIRRANMTQAVLQVGDAFLPSDFERHPFVAAQGLLQQVGVDVPKILGTSPSRGWILLEDLGDEALQRHVSFESYNRILETSLIWNFELSKTSSKLPEKFKSAPHFGWAFDFQKLHAEMAYTAEHLFDGYLGLSGKNFLDACTANNKYLDRRPRFFCHRDFHSRNVMVKENRLVVIDFQDARLGPLSYDLVSLLWDPYVRLEEETRERLLTRWKTIVGTRAPQGMDEEILRMRVQRLLKAAGSYASFLRLKGRKDYLPSIRPALEDTTRALKFLTQPEDSRLLTLVDEALLALPEL